MVQLFTGSQVQWLYYSNDQLSAPLELPHALAFVLTSENAAVETQPLTQGDTFCPCWCCLPDVIIQAGPSYRAIRVGLPLLAPTITLVRRVTDKGIGTAIHDCWSPGWLTGRRDQQRRK